MSKITQTTYGRLDVAAGGWKRYRHAGGYILNYHRLSLDVHHRTPI